MSIHLRWVHWYFLAFTVAVLVVEGSAAHVAGDVLVANAVALAAATMLMYLLQRTLMSSVRASARESDRTRRILETATDAYIEMSDTGRVTEWNDQAEATFGWSRAEAVGQLVAELIIPLELRAAHLAGVTRILDTGASGPLRRASEVPARHRDGTEFTVEISTWVTADGDRRRFNALLQDISGRKRAEEELRQARDRFQQAFDNAPIGMSLAHVDGTLVEVNQVFCGMLGRNKQDLVGTKDADITHEDDLQGSAELSQQAASGQWDSFQIEKRYRHADGSAVLSILSISVVRDAGGTPQFLMAQAQDVTRSRQADVALAREQAFLGAVLEHLDAGILACDGEGRLTLFNRASREMHGLPDTSIDAAQWADHYRLYRTDGMTPLPTEEIPLYRAFRGEHVRNAEVVAIAVDGEPRALVVNGRSLTDDDGALLGAVVAIHDVTERRKAEAALSRQALHDPLTDLANRLLLRDRLEHALTRRVRYPAPLALLLLDLDGFKTVNDSLGHDAGDQVLLAVADRLRTRLRPEDTVCRLGGDEFAVLLESTTQVQAHAIADELLAAVGSPMRVHSASITIEGSIGIVVSESDGDPEQLLRDADLAMYAAKSQGRGRAVAFESSMHDAALERFALDVELRQAIAEDRVTVEYQPIVSLVTGKLQGFEALARWDHSERGPVPPATFIPVAESTGLIVPLGESVLRQACLQFRRWKDRHTADQDLTMAVNLSVRQLQEPSLVETVRTALVDAGLDAGDLVLEITESAMLSRGDSITAIGQLHAIGVGLAIDDFGTGYSSLGRLNALPIDKVKIDKSFVDELAGGGPAPIVAATIAMAHSLGLQTVAEGVENIDQLPFLRLHGCDEIQGFLFGGPVDAATMDALLLERGTGCVWTEAANSSVNPGLP